MGGALKWGPSHFFSDPTQLPTLSCHQTGCDAVVAGPRGSDKPRANNTITQTEKRQVHPIRHHTILSVQLKNRIKRNGPITFRDFMAAALYDPQHGFYTKGPAIGTMDGAFNTNAMFPAFAYALSRAITEAEQLVGELLRIIEIGGGTGELGANLRSFLSVSHEYVVVDRSSNLRVQQTSRGLPAIESVKSLTAAPTFVFGNEVLDALPVHRIFNDGSNHLLEMYVGLDAREEFIELPDQPSTPRLAAYLQDEDIRLGRGQIAEICLDLEEFLQTIAPIISKGYLVFIDYGDDSTSKYSQDNKNGTMRSFRSQTQTFDSFDYIGEQDLTADVDFTAVENAALKVGLFPAGRTRQGIWLRNLGIDSYVEYGHNTQSTVIEIDRLTHMAKLGSTFDVQMFKTPGIPDGPGLHPHM